jgi:competence protein ComEA
VQQKILEEKKMKNRVWWFTVLTFTMTILMSGLLFAADLVNVNTANLEELQTLQGIGEVRAQAIIKYRETYGPFKSLDELRNVTGIGDRIIEANRAIITFQQGTADAEKPASKSDDVRVDTKHYVMPQLGFSRSNMPQWGRP